MNRFLISLIVALAACAVSGRKINHIRSEESSESTEIKHSAEAYALEGDINGDGVWLDWDITKDSVPPNAVVGGDEGKGKVYVIRALHTENGRSGWYPGKYTPSQRYAAYALHREISVTKFQILRHTNYTWESGNYRVPGGFDMYGELLYICCAKITKVTKIYVVPGKFQANACWVPFENKEIKASTYMLLGRLP